MMIKKLCEYSHRTEFILTVLKNVLSDELKDGTWVNMYLDQYGQNINCNNPLVLRKDFGGTRIFLYKERIAYILKDVYGGPWININISSNLDTAYELFYNGVVVETFGDINSSTNT